jgi:hypothetical protein
MGCERVGDEVTAVYVAGQRISVPSAAALDDYDEALRIRGKRCENAAGRVVNLRPISSGTTSGLWWDSFWRQSPEWSSRAWADSDPGFGIS